MSHHPHITTVAITGGIGAGKSVVSSILRNVGYSVYDCDIRAKQLMNSSPAIRDALTSHFGLEVYHDDGTLNRQLLSSIIFNDSEALKIVNGIVHPAVRDDIVRWRQEEVAGIKQPVFIETAILNESGLDAMVDAVWNVVAPVEVRIERVIKRNNASRQQVIERITSQASSLSCSKPVTELTNDGIMPLLPQVMNVLNQT